MLFPSGLKITSCAMTDKMYVVWFNSHSYRNFVFYSVTFWNVSLAVVCHLGGQTETKTDSCGSMMTTTEQCFISCAIQTPAKLCIKTFRVKSNIQQVCTTKRKDNETRTWKENIPDINLLSHQLIELSFCLGQNTTVDIYTFSLSEDRGLSTVGFWGQNIQQSQTASRRSPHPWHRSSCSWRRSNRPERNRKETVKQVTACRERFAVENESLAPSLDKALFEMVILPCWVCL